MKDPRYRNHRRGCECEKRLQKRVELGKLFDKFKSDAIRIKLEDQRVIDSALEIACVKPGCYL